MCRSWFLQTFRRRDSARFVGSGRTGLLAQITRRRRHTESVHPLCHPTSTLRLRATATNELLQQKNEHLARLCDTAQKFVDNVSHEFRTPLTVIKEYVSLLQRGGWYNALDADQCRFLDVVADRACRPEYDGRRHARRQQVGSRYSERVAARRAASRTLWSMCSQVSKKSVRQGRRTPMDVTKTATGILRLGKSRSRDH